MGEQGALVSEGKEELLNRGFGELQDSQLLLDPFETLFLVEKGKIDVGKSFEEVLDFFSSRIDMFEAKYRVFKDFRERGYVIKTGLKFGAHFRVYPRGIKPGEGHSNVLVHVYPENLKLEMPELSRMVRLARAVRKKIYIAIVDREGDVVYYEFKRVKP